MPIQMILPSPLTADSLLMALTSLDWQGVSDKTPLTLEPLLDGYLLTIKDIPVKKTHPNTGKKYRCGYVNKHDERCTRGTRHRGDHDYTGVWNG